MVQAPSGFVLGPEATAVALTMVRRMEAGAEPAAVVKNVSKMGARSSVKAVP